MLLIFGFSARNGGTSTGDSNTIGRLIGNTFISDFSSWSDERQLDFAQKIDFPIRKTAHATEYAILGIFLMGAFITDRTRKAKCYVILWGVGTLYAISDEVHQLFVPGRSGRAFDVCIDSTGVAIGVCAFLCFGSIWRRLRHKR